MPADFPDFPSRAQMEAYYNAFADEFKLRERIMFNGLVTRVRPRTDDRWDVTIRLPSGAPEDRIFKGIVVCNGHHWDKSFPDWVGDYTGALIHSKDYKRPKQLVGKRVLVLGGGNSGCDLASEAGRVGVHCDWSLRRGYHFQPKTILGRPSVELINPWTPIWVQRIVAWLLRLIAIGRYSDYGLPKPDHKLFEAHPTVNSEIFHYLKHGRVSPRPNVVGVRHRTVLFADGQEAEFDLVVCATGYRVSFPFFHDSLCEVIGKTAQTVGGCLLPGRKHLYIVGTGQVRYGIGPLIRPYALLIADWIKVQDGMELPMADVLVAMGARPPTTHLMGPHEALRGLKLARMLRGRIIKKELRMRARGAKRIPPLDLDDPEITIPLNKSV
jgi:hypothetical protein